MAQKINFRKRASQILGYSNEMPVSLMLSQSEVEGQLDQRKLNQMLQLVSDVLDDEESK